MTRIRSVGIFGLGLIGGSLARDLSQRGVRVCAYDRDGASLRAALDAGVVSAPLDKSCADTADLDALVIALPVNAALELLSATADRLAGVPLISDVCSTKRTIVQAAQRLGLRQFVGAHPLAGDHRTGWAASRAGLFTGATVYFCPTDATPAAPLAMLQQLWAHTGAFAEIIDAEAHDRLVALTSHLPQAASTALARVLASAGIPRDRLGPGGRDMVRLARSPADTWTPIALDNARSLGAALAALEQELATMREALDRDDQAAVHGFFALRPPPPLAAHGGECQALTG